MIPPVTLAELCHSVPSHSIIGLDWLALDVAAVVFAQLHATPEFWSNVVVYPAFDRVKLADALPKLDQEPPLLPQPLQDATVRAPAVVRDQDAA